MHLEYLETYTLDTLKKIAIELAEEHCDIDLRWVNHMRQAALIEYIKEKELE